MIGLGPATFRVYSKETSDPMVRFVQSLARNRAMMVAFWLAVVPAFCGTLMAGVMLLFTFVCSLFVRLPGKWFVFAAGCFFVCGFVTGLRLAWPRFRDHWSLWRRWRSSVRTR